jgi:phosphonate transport system substrate-binding protein
MLHALRRITLPAIMLVLAGCTNATSPVSPSSASVNTTSADTSVPADAVLRFSAIPDQDKTELKEKFDLVASYLANELGVRVEYVPSSDYKASVDAFKNGDIQLAWFGGLTGVQARHAVAGARAIAQGAIDPTFKSYFIAHVDTGLELSEEFPRELKQFKFSFGSGASTSGRLMPESFIKENTGKPPQAFFASPPIFSGSHDKTIALVESGQVQAGVVNFKVYDKRVAEGKTDPNTCKIIWVTPEYADYNFTAHPDLETTFGKGFIDKLQLALISIDDPALLSAFPRESLIEANNEDFAGIKTVAIDLGFLR